MHWWFHPRVPVHFGMFCCGRSKGDEGPRKLDDSTRAAPTPRPKRKQPEDITSSNRLLDRTERETDLDATQEETENHRLLPDISEPLNVEKIAVTTNDSDTSLETVLGVLSVSDPSNKRPSVSESLLGRQRDRDSGIEDPETAEKSQNSSNLQDVTSSCTPDANKEHKHSDSRAETRAREPLTRTEEQDQVLKELSLHPRLQASEQRIQYHHDTTQQPRLHITQQYQSQFQTEQQEKQRIHQQQKQQQEKQRIHQQQKQQPQPQKQYLKTKHPHNFSETFPSPSIIQQTLQPILHNYYEQNHKWQQSAYYQLQNQQQQTQQKYLQQLQQTYQQQNQLLHYRRGHETPDAPVTSTECNTLQQKLVNNGTLSRSFPKNKSPQRTATAAASLIANHTSSSNVYANVRMSSSGCSAIGPVGLEMEIKSMEVEDDSFVVETVEIIKRPGQTLGFYIREGNGFDRSDGVFISRIQMGTVAQTNGLLHVGDEIVTVNNVKVGNMSLDDVVILMSIPKKLVLTIRTRRNSSKNKSCPVLPIVENSDPPIVVLKKGRSSSASALEMTEKCPDLYEPGQTYSQYPFQTADYMPRRDLNHERPSQSTSRYASVFISPQRVEAKLVNEDGMESSTSSDGSLPRSVDSSKGRSFLNQEAANSALTSYMSVTNPIYDHFSSMDYKHHLTADNISRKATVPKLHSKQSVASQMHGYRGWAGPDSSPSYGEPPYINVGALREGLMQQHYQPHQPSFVHSQQHQQLTFPHSSQQYQFQPQPQIEGHAVHTSPHGTSYTISSQQYRDTPLSQEERRSQQYRDTPLSQEERRSQEKLRTFLNSKSRHGRLLRSRSPTCYNSDSELIFTHQQQIDGRGFASDYETYGGAFSDDEPVYSIPRIPSNSSSELEMLLKKFTSLSQELQQEQSKLQRQLSSRDKSGRAGQLPLSRAESLSGDEYGCQSLSRQGSPGPVRRAASTQTPILPPRLIRNPSADTPPFMYSAYQHESHPDLSGRSMSVAGNICGGMPLSLASALPLSTSQTSIQLAKQGESSAISPRTASARLRDLQLTHKPLHIPYSEFEPYKADMKKRVELTRTGGLDGLLNIHIMSGQGLKSSKTSLRDLYCVVAVDSLNKARTMIRTGAINFDWDESFDVDLEDSKEASFLIYHWDPNYKHRLCFHGSILLPGYVHSGHKRYVAIKLEPKGILFVTLLYKEPALSLQRLPSMKKNALFGVDLETIILREHSGLNIPLLVHKCVHEVERRGLDTVGIYRLCGSARRKTILREAFENSAQYLDLSSENVSDIHVITGVLKDFLRELPEPLFTIALYQMLLDALSVRLPCDPEGSAKLMLSILECLPSANQDTMALLLNHLRRVASHSDKNKMPIDNLAICFGPVLLCPAPGSTRDQSLDFRKHIDVLKYLLEIWEYQGSTSSEAGKPSNTDTLGYGDTGNSPQQPSQQANDPGLRHSLRDDICKFSIGDSSGALGPVPRQ